MDQLALNPVTAAQFLGVIPRTIRNWLKSGRAPRAALLALWWETPSGRSHQVEHIYEDANLQRGLVAALRAEVRMLETAIARLHAIGDFEALNDPGVPGQARRPVHESITTPKTRQQPPRSGNGW
ncbi:MAG: hypothetical protein WAQ08_05900 [Aquabacterium sp.]|jgi:hypothetical protein|uniref:hypothetical protein n=1 Tax=Aquabacterium sp. TaxID=1872578 RepID=UPI003BAE9A79